MIANRPGRLASVCSSVSAALVLTLASSCNLVLDNEKRSLSQQYLDSLVEPEAGAPDSSVGSGAPDAGPDNDASSEPGRCGGPFRQCMPNEIDPGKEACGDCGAGTRTRQRGCTIDCRWGSWSEWSECQQPAEVCKPGATGERMEPCGYCSLGTRKASRGCTSSCAWSDWSLEPCIEDEATCEPGKVLKLPEVECSAMCGRSVPTQTCNASCAWDPVVAGACMSEGICKPGDTRMAAPGGCNANYCNKGVQQQIETCTQSCTWGTPTAMGACTIPTGICRPADLGGSGWRCRPNDPGFRELCNPSTTANACTWSGTREAFSGC